MACKFLPEYLKCSDYEWVTAVVCLYAPGVYSSHDETLRVFFKYIEEVSLWTC